MIEKLVKIIKGVVKEKVKIDVLISEKEEFGHYSTNVAFTLAPLLKKLPFEIAKDLVEKLNTAGGKYFSKIEAVAPGFVNFWLRSDIFQKELAVILKDKDKYGRNDILKGQKVMVEYTDPNPFKEFHIGHLMSNAIGEAISKILEWNGAKVKRACYQGDVGLHVAKAIWGLLRKNPSIGSGRETKKLSIKELADAYVFGAKAYEADIKSKEQINSINKEIYSQSNGEISRIYKIGRKLSLDYFEIIYKKLGTKFDYYFFESETGGIGKKVVEKNLGGPSTDSTGSLQASSGSKKIFEKSDGAIVFKGEKYGLHTRVFINSEGLPTYEAKELGLAKIKFKKYAYDKSVVVTGNEINEYFKVLLKAMETVFPDLAQKTKHLSHGMLRFPTGKMSSRTGNVIAAESLIGEVEKLVSEKIKERKLSVKEKSEIEEMVAVGALKYSILKQAIGGDIIFDFGKSISFEGDSGPYLQYAYTRAKSILEKAKEEKVKPSLKLAPEDVSEVERMLCRFPEIVKSIGMAYAPHYLVTYLTELARVFNAYYAKVKIVDGSDKYSPYKVALTFAFMTVMGNGLEILGISRPEKM